MSLTDEREMNVLDIDTTQLSGCHGDTIYFIAMDFQVINTMNEEKADHWVTAGL